MGDNLQPIFERFTSKPQKFLHHYTGVGTLLSMLKNDEPEFWLSDIAYLNDSQELLYAHEIMENLLAESEYTKNRNQAAIPFLKLFSSILGLKNNIHAHVYVMSFSEAPDNLNQWRSYTPHGKGIDLTFNFREPEDFLSENNISLVKCEYEKEKQIDLVNRLIIHIEESFSIFFEDHLWPASTADINMTKELDFHFRSTLSLGYKIFSIIKHPAFKDEQEWRLVCLPSEHHGIDVDYREGSNMLIPYIKTRIDLEKYLNAIIIGPTEHKDLSMEAILGLLKKHNRSKIGTSCSQIPYREW